MEYLIFMYIMSQIKSVQSLILIILLKVYTYFNCILFIILLMSHIMHLINEREL